MNDMHPSDSSTIANLIHLPPLVRFRFHLLAQDMIHLPNYPGSAWRGFLGHGLRRTACVTRQPTCAGCLLMQQCVYSTIFETPATTAESVRGYTALPHPFVLAIDLAAPRHLSPGTAFSLTIHLLGPAIAQAPYLIHALGVAGQRGFGRDDGGRFTVTSLDYEPQLGGDDWVTVYDAETGVYDTPVITPPRLPAAPAAVRIRLITPLRIKRDGHFVGARELRIQDILQTLARRLASLATHYGGNLQQFDLRPLVQDTATLQLQVERLKWHDWTRYSSRQDTRMQLGGLLGELHLSGAGLPALWPALWFGQWAHIGKSTAFGLGGYRVS